MIELHQKNAGGNERIAAPCSAISAFPMIIAISSTSARIQQGLANQDGGGILALAQAPLHGHALLAANDTWPVASWQALITAVAWKAMHYMVKRFFQPVAVAAIPNGETSSFPWSMIRRKQ